MHCACFIVLQWTPFHPSFVHFSTADRCDDRATPVARNGS
jgi:hypothetical protein